MYPDYVEYADLVLFLDEAKTNVLRVAAPSAADKSIFDGARGFFITRGDGFALVWDDGCVQIGGVNL